ncbi:MAG: hypothetical protein LQ343_004395 [Gyalolechia ehrenbergii]|nr:MAG: hypothetical protein LQ343_004395 [Gyalolechia ehrenbergii]
MFSKMLHLMLLLVSFFFSLVTASPINATLVPRKDYEPGDTLDRTMCFCTNNNNFTQWKGTRSDQPNRDNQPSNPYAFEQVPAGHEVAFVYKFDYYNHRSIQKMSRMLTHETTPHSIDHHFSLHALDKCTTAADRQPNACLDWQSQHRDWCHTFFTADVPPKVKLHSWEFCYQFRGDSFNNPQHRDFWTFYKDKRGLPRERDWIGDEDAVRQRCAGVCEEMWGMQVFEDRLGGGWFGRMDHFHVSF